MYISARKTVYPFDAVVSQNLSMHDSYKRLLSAAKELRGWANQAEVARGLTKEGYEVADAVLNNWRIRGVSKEGRLKASLIIGCRPHWVESGEGVMKEMGGLAGMLSEMKWNASEGITRAGMVPLISWVQAGVWSEVVDHLSPGDAEDWVPVYQAVGVHTFALKIKGNSMEPDFRDGDIIIVDPTVNPTPGDFVVAKNDEEEATFKKYRPRGLNEKGVNYFELVPLNPDYETMRSDLQPIHIIGTAVDHMRRLRKP